MEREREREYSMKQMMSSVRREKGGSGGAEDEVGEESEEMGEIIGLWNHLVQPFHRIFPLLNAYYPLFSSFPLSLSLCLIDLLLGYVWVFFCWCVRVSMTQEVAVFFFWNWLLVFVWISRFCIVRSFSLLFQTLSVVYLQRLLFRYFQPKHNRKAGL